MVTYTSSGGLSKPATGEYSGTWGNIANTNFDLIDRLVNGTSSISLTSYSVASPYPLATSDGALSVGQYLVLTFTGSPAAAVQVNITPQDATKIYFVKNTCGQTVTMYQGSGATVSIATGASKLIYTDGLGSTASVYDFTSYLSMSNAQITGGTINGATVGITTAAAAAFTTLSSSALATLSSMTTSAATISGGSVNGTPIGASSASTGAFSTLSASSTTTLSGQLGLGGANYGTSGQVVVSQGAGSAPVWGSGFPSGGIILWSGSVASIPSGWLLCNGSSGTPDLRDRFVVGAGSTYAVANTGGAASVTLSESQIPSHTHTFSGTTNTVGDHTHTINISYSPDFDYYGNNVTGLNAGQNGANSVTGQSVNLTTAGAGNHSHTVSGTTGAAGSGGSHENRPPYYALAYIMKS
jgi:microcystin-dependent protein